MNIACLAWGSLVWDSRELPIRRRWFTDGPFGHVEFARKSNDDRITLVLCPGSELVRLLWAQMDAGELGVAREALRARENLTAKDWSKDIEDWQAGQAEPALIPRLSTWAEANGVDAVIWTSLKPKFETDRIPDADEVVAHLHSLQGAQRDNAEQYVRYAPAQIDTKYRRRIEASLGWTYRAAH
jgi:hypothetical protein